MFFFFFSSRRRHTRLQGDWSSDVCSSDLPSALAPHLAALKSIASTLEETTADEREDEIDRTALLNEIRVTLRRFERERPQAKNPGFWLSHLLGGLHFLLGRRDRTPEERAVSLAGRLEDVPRLLDDARA